MSKMAARSQYIYNMEYSKRQELVNLLDIDDSWKRLAAEIKLPTMKIIELENKYQRVGRSASDALLTYWGHSNPTIAMLESTLVKLNLIGAAQVIRFTNAENSMFDSSRLRTGLLVSSSGYHASQRNGSTLLHDNAKSDRVFDNKRTVNCQNAEENDDLGFPLPFQEDSSSKPKQMSSSSSASPYRQPLVVNCFTNKMNIVGSPGSNSPIWKGGNSNGTMSTSSNNNIYYEGGGGGVESPNKRPSSYGSSVNFNVPQDNRYNGSKQTSEADFGRRSEADLPKPDTMMGLAGGRLDMGRSSRSSSSVSSSASGGDMQSMILHPYSGIVSATRNFCRQQLIGEGGFGKVYSGNIQSTMFAIKVLSTTANQADFLAEVKFLQKFRHKNIIMLSGCSIDGPSLCLIYEFMVNGSLRDRLECLDGSRPLPWHARQSILKDAAAGLQYLHNAQNKPLIHGDMKSANILIGPHFEAKISDFGLAKEATGGSVMNQYTHVTHVQNDPVYGTKPYLPPSFFNDFTYSMRTDTHGFGIVIFETCTGEKPYDSGRKGGKMLLDYIHEICSYNNSSKTLSIRDKTAADWPNELWMKLFEIGSLCTSALKKDVPTMKQVHYCMEQLMKLQQISQCSPSPYSPGLEQKVAEPPTSYAASHIVKKNDGYEDIKKWQLQQQDFTNETYQKEVLDVRKEAFLDYDERKLALSSETYEPMALPNVSRVETTAMRVPMQESRKSPEVKADGAGFVWTNAMRRSIDGCNEKELISVLRREDAATALQPHLNSSSVDVTQIRNNAKIVKEPSEETISSVFTNLTCGTSVSSSSSPGFEKSDDVDRFSTDDNFTTTDTDDEIKYENIDYTSSEASLYESNGNDVAIAARFLKDQQEATCNLSTATAYPSASDRSYTVDMRMVATDEINRLKNKDLPDFLCDSESFQEPDVAASASAISKQDSPYLQPQASTKNNVQMPMASSSAVPEIPEACRENYSCIGSLNLVSNSAHSGESSANENESGSKSKVASNGYSTSDSSSISLERVLAQDLQRGMRLEALKNRRLQKQSNQERLLQ